MRSTQAPVTRVRPWKVAKTGGVGSQLHITILAALNLLCGAPHNKFAVMRTERRS